MISRLSYNGANEKFCGTCKAAPSGNFLRLSPPDCVVLESLAVTVKSWVCFPTGKGTSRNTENENKRCKIFNKVLNMNWDYVRGKKKKKGK